MKGTEAELASRTRCWKCQELGHYSRDCPNRSQPSGSPKKTTFIVHKPQHQHGLSYPVTFPRPPDGIPAPNLRSIRGIFVGLRCRAFEGLVDTAAEDAVMGSHALRALREELSTVGLQPLRVTGQQSIPCAGIGGDAVIQEVVDVPTCIAGLLGIIRFSVVQDSETMATPPLLPISYLEAVGAIIDVANNQYTTTDGYSAPLRRLPSGHRAINMLAFHMTPWVLPRAQRVNGRDPFQLDPEVAEHPPSPPSSPDGPPSSQRFSKGSKSYGGPRSYSGVSVGPPPTVAAPSGPSRVLASQFYAPEGTVELEEMEPMELIEEAGAMNENNENEELVFEEEGESAEMTSEGMESPPLPVIPETSVFPVPVATPERPNPEDRVVVMQTRESDGMTAHEVEHHGENEIDSVEEEQPGSTGGIFKSRLEAILHEATVTTPWEFTLAVYECVTAHNRYYHRSGYTPYQRAFGILPRLPASLLSDDYVDKELLLQGAGDEVKRSWEIREAAGHAWLRWQDNDAVRRAISTRTRTSDNKVFKEGDLVYVWWRDVPNYKGWTGPGTIVAQHSNGRSLWVSLRGYLVKASKEQIRHATSEESLGAELVKNLSQDMLRDLESGRLRNYKDVEDEGLPGEEEEYTPSIAPQDEALPTIPEEGETVNLDMEIDELLGPDPGDSQARRDGPRLPAELPQPMEAEDQSTQHPESHASESAQPSTINTPRPSAPPSRRVSVGVDEGRNG